MERALPAQPWGPGRLDAVAMIFNRLTGLDIGPPPSFLIPDNIQPADAPVRYPFLWNAAIQDMTQWPGFAENGNDVLALARNLGEVLGVFATFHPQKDNWHVLRVDYTGRNSANFDGLDRLEDLIRDLGPPKWPWAVDTALAAQGKAIFERPNEAGGCVGCHGIEPGVTRFPNQKTWKTPIQDVGTDSREYQILARTARTGVLEGARIPLVTQPLQATDTAFNVLRTSVLGSIIQHYVPVAATASADTEAPGAGEESLTLAATARRAARRVPESDHRGPARRSRSPGRAGAIPLRVACDGRHLGHRSLSPQWLGPVAGRAPQAGGGAGGLVQDRP